MDNDPCEKTNLVSYKTGEVRSDVSVPGWTAAELKAKNQQLKSQLAEQEAILLA